MNISLGELQDYFWYLQFPHHLYLYKYLDYVSIINLLNPLVRKLALPLQLHLSVFWTRNECLCLSLTDFVLKFITFSHQSMRSKGRRYHHYIIYQYYFLLNSQYSKKILNDGSKNELMAIVYLLRLLALPS